MRLRIIMDDFVFRDYQKRPPVPSLMAGEMEENMRKTFIVLAASAAFAGLSSSASIAEGSKASGVESRLIMLGTAGGPTWYGESSPHGISTALVINDKAYLVDFGSGAFRQLRTAGIKPGSEAALFITHLHSDHVIDLPSLLMYDPSARKRAKAAMKIFGPGSRGDLPPVAGSATEDMVIHPENPVPGTVAMVDGIIGAFATDMNVRVRHEGVPDVRGFFEVADIKLPEGSKIDAQTGELPSMEPFEVWVDDNVRVSATLVYHGEVFPSLAYRFDTANGSVVFSGDTAVSENLIRLAKDADILVHEAIDPSWVAKIVGPEPWDDRQKALAHQLETTHVTPRQAGEVATKAGVKTLVLSHLVPGDAPREHWLEAGETFKGNLIIGEDLAEIKLGD